MDCYGGQWNFPIMTTVTPVWVTTVVKCSARTASLDCCYYGQTAGSVYIQKLFTLEDSGYGLYSEAVERHLVTPGFQPAWSSEELNIFSNWL